MKLSRKKQIGYFILTAVFILMCVLKLWFTILLVFAFGLVVTLIQRKKSFCAGYCPMAAVQDSMYQKHSPRRPNLVRFLQKRLVKTFIAVFFWSYIGFFLIFFRSSPQILWQAMVSLMLGSTAIAVLLQFFTRKRVWCSTICPFGNMLSTVTH